jgi:hypothetical protein
MTSTVCAQPLEEAIKGVDVSGMMRYRYDEKSDSVTKKATANNAYRLDVNTKAKVNDVITANVTVGLGTDLNTGDTGADKSLASNASDAAPTLNVRNANFTAALGFATVIAGKQSIPGPFVDNSSDDISRGTGAVALIPAGPVTIAAGHFVNHNVTKSFLDSAAVKAYLPVRNATELAVLGSVAGVSFDAWYANVTDTLSAISIGAKGSVAGVTIDARHSSLDMSDAYAALGLTAAVAGKDTATLTKVVASTKVGGATLVAGLALTGEDNGKFENRMAIDGDNDAQSDFRLWQASAGQLSDATAFLIGAGMEVMPAVTADVKYLTVDFGTGSQGASELLVGLTYAMSKNFSVHTRYSMYDQDNANGSKASDSDMGRLELKYTF